LILQAGFIKLGSKAILIYQRKERFQERSANVLTKNDCSELEVPDEIPTPHSAWFRTKAVEPLTTTLLKPSGRSANHAGNHFKRAAHANAYRHGQLHAVLGHEQAHLSQRHHLVLTLAELLETAFGRVGLFAAAHAEIARLVEMAADDAAIRHSDRLTLASALLTLASGRAPAPALGAGGTTAAQRIRRLIESPRPARNSAEAAMAVVGRASGLATAVGLIAVPAMAVTVVVSCCC